MNHFIYADDSCIFGPSPSSIQKLLSICDTFGRTNYIIFNPSKSVYIVFTPKKFNLVAPELIFNSANLKRSFDTKYLGFRLNAKLCDNDDILKELRLLYIRANVLIRTFNKCSDLVKIKLFKSYCTSLYCSHLWSDYKKSVFSKIRVGYNNVFRKLLKLQPRSSASLMFATNNVLNFEALIRSIVFFFTKRLESSRNSIIQSLYNNYTCKYIIWNHWQTLLYT